MHDNKSPKIKSPQETNNLPAALSPNNVPAHYAPAEMEKLLQPNSTTKPDACSERDRSRKPPRHPDGKFLPGVFTQVSALVLVVLDSREKRQTPVLTGNTGIETPAWRPGPGRCLPVNFGQNRPKASKFPPCWIAAAAPGKGAQAPQWKAIRLWNRAGTASRVAGAELADRMAL
jgi:hypothetical protein